MENSKKLPGNTHKKILIIIIIIIIINKNYDNFRQLTTTSENA